MPAQIVINQQVCYHSLSAAHNNNNVLGVDDGVVNQTMHTVGVAMYSYKRCAMINILSRLKFTFIHIFAPSGHPDLFNYAQTSVFSVKYLGHLKNVSPQSGRLSSAENQTVTLEAIDTAQVHNSTH